MKVMRMSDDEAYEVFKSIRWAANDGDAVCPRCGCCAAYEYKARKIFKCKGCDRQFSLTTDTIFASRKMPIRDILAAIAIFVNGAKGISALQLSRDLDCQYKTAYVLAHKLREAMGTEVEDLMLSGNIEVDGAYFGGYVRPENLKEDRKDRRFKKNQSGKRRVVVVLRERGGRTLPKVFKSEAASLRFIYSRVEKGSRVYADEASSWDDLHARYNTLRINHSQVYSDYGICTNQAESFFSRLRRAEIGTHHHVSGKYLQAYANENAWREDHRRVSNGGQFMMVVGAALKARPSSQWKGYWQRSA